MKQIELIMRYVKKNDAKRVANLEQVTIRQGQEGEMKMMNQKQQ